MAVDPYVDTKSGVLRNRLGITDPQRLQEAEAGLTLAALADLGARVLPGKYDLDHLRSFHREIFGDIYPWAGEIRGVGIARSDPFCLPQHIESYSTDVFAVLATERCLRGLPRDSFLERLTHYFAEVNAIHPFARVTAVPSGPSSASSAAMQAGRSTGPLWTGTRTSGPRQHHCVVTTDLFASFSTQRWFVDVVGAASAPASRHSR